MKQKLSEIADITMGQPPLSGCYNSDGIGTPFCRGAQHLEESIRHTIPGQLNLAKALTKTMFYLQLERLSAM